MFIFTLVNAQTALHNNMRITKNRKLKCGSYNNTGLLFVAGLAVREDKVNTVQEITLFTGFLLAFILMPFEIFLI